MKKTMILKYLQNIAGIFCSRILGLIRDILVARFLGAGVFSDIFVLILQMPSLFRRVFAEGAFSQSFLPHLKIMDDKGRFCVKVILTLGFMAFILCLIAAIFPRVLLLLFASGFSDEMLLMAQDLVRISFWFLFFIFFISFLSALLNYEHKFFIASFSYSFFNLGCILALLLFKDEDKLYILHKVAVFIIISAILQTVFLCFFLRKNEILFSFFKNLKNYFKIKNTGTFFKKFTQASFGASAMQLSTILDTQIASYLAVGGISYLYYANRIYLLPLALIATAFSQVIFSRFIHSDEQNRQYLLTKGLEMMCSLLILAALGGIYLSDFIIFLIFEGGSFTRTDTFACSLVLQGFLLALPAAGINRLLISDLAASNRQGELALISFLHLFLNLILALALAFQMGVLGLALAHALSAYLMSFVYIFKLGKKRFLASIRPKFWLAFGAFVLLYAFLLRLLGQWLTSNLDLLKGMFC